MLLKNRPRNEYRLKDGSLVPGVTTVLGALEKPALMKWAWESGKNGIPWPIPSDGTAGVGTITHYKIHQYLLGETESYDDKWDREHILAADTPYNMFVNYYRNRNARLILSEYGMVHEKSRYGGTLDLLVSTDTGIELWDIKTSKAIYDEYWIQLAGYDMLLRQHSKFRRCKITPRVVLVTKDGRLDAPDISKDYFDKARNTWVKLIKMYHELNAFRKAA